MMSDIIPDTEPKSAEIELVQLKAALEHLVWHWEHRTMPKVATHDPKRARDLRIYVQTLRNLMLEVGLLPADATPEDVKAIVHNSSLNALLVQNSKSHNQ